MLNDPLIAFEDGGFVCPLDGRTPQRDWCVVARDDGVAGRAVVTLVPVSLRPVDDDAREGVMMKTRPVLTRAGKRIWLCTGYSIMRYLNEVVPPFGIPDVVDTVLPVGFRKAVGGYADWRVPFRKATRTANHPDDQLDWWLNRYLKSRLYEAVCDPGAASNWWQTVTTSEALDALDEYDPPVRVGTPPRVAENIVDVVRALLTAYEPARRIATLI